MSTRGFGTVSVVLGLSRSSSHSNDGVRCPDCEAGLVLHQPDEWNPDRLLGVCEECSRWFLLDLRPDQSTWMVVSLPDPASFRDVPGQ